MTRETTDLILKECVDDIVNADRMNTEFTFKSSGTTVTVGGLPAGTKGIMVDGVFKRTVSIQKIFEKMLYPDTN